MEVPPKVRMPAAAKFTLWSTGLDGKGLGMAFPALGKGCARKGTSVEGLPEIGLKKRFAPAKKGVCPFSWKLSSALRMSYKMPNPPRMLVFESPLGSQAKPKR